jgi:hypothetical protein
MPRTSGHGRLICTTTPRSGSPARKAQVARLRRDACASTWLGLFDGRQAMREECRMLVRRPVPQETEVHAAAVGISSIQRQNGTDLQSQNLGSSRVGRLNICMIVECDGPVGARAGLAGLIRGGLIEGRRGKHQPGRRLGLCDALPDVGIENRKFAINVGGVQRLVELRKGRHRRLRLEICALEGRIRRCVLQALMYRICVATMVVPLRRS